MLFSERVKIAWSLFCKVKLLFNVSCECSVFALLDNSFCKLFISSISWLCFEGLNSSGIFVKESQLCLCSIFALLDNSFCKLFISSMLCLCSDGENSSGIFVKEL